MKKSINLVLLLIFLLLVALFAYKQLSTTEILKSNLEAPITGSVTSNLANYVSKEELNDAIKDYLMTNPEVLLASLEVLHNKKINESSAHAADFLKTNKELVEKSENPPLLGNPDGDIIIVLFYDYNCSFCKKAHAIEKELLEKDHGVKLILRPTPILGDSSNYAAKVILAVQAVAPEYLSQIHHDLMSLKTIDQESTKVLLSNYKIDYASIENEINSYAIKQALEKNFALAKELGVKGTPSYVINGNFAPGMISLEKFQNAIMQLRAVDAPQAGQAAAPEKINSKNVPSKKL
jgi:protein-disulfide isomerase